MHPRPEPAQSDDPFPPGEIRRLLRSALGARVEIVECQVGNRQRDYQVLLLRLRRPALRVVLKLAGPQAEMAASFERTALLHRLVAAQTRIPMPEILALDTSCRSWPWRYFLRTHLPGQEWASVRPQISPDELPGAYRQIGEAVAQLHSIHFPAFGHLEADGNPPAGQACLPALKQHARAIIRSPRLQETFLYLLDKEHNLFYAAGQPVLCHEDLHQHNLLFAPRRGRWQLASILDFDKAWAGPAESDLARLEFWRGMTHPAFWQAYRAVCPVDPGYPERRPIYQLLWCLEYARSTPEHLADTQRLLEQFSLPPLDAFEDPPPLTIHWAPRLRPEKIRRLYQGEAQGLLDEELLDEVFHAIDARARSIFTCTEAADGRVACPVCCTIIQRHDISNTPASKAEVIRCTRCAWRGTWGAYLKSYQGKQLLAGGSGPALRTYVDGAPQASTPRQKLLLIDALIHAYHWEAENSPTRPVAVNLIAGDNQAVIDLLLGLAYGKDDREMQQTRLAWVDKTRTADERRDGTLYGGNL